MIDIKNRLLPIIIGVILSQPLLVKAMEDAPEQQGQAEQPSWGQRLSDVGSSAWNAGKYYVPALGAVGVGAASLRSVPGVVSDIASIRETGILPLTSGLSGESYRKWSRQNDLLDSIHIRLRNSSLGLGFASLLANIAQSSSRSEQRPTKRPSAVRYLVGPLASTLGGAALSYAIPSDPDGGFSSPVQSPLVVAMASAICNAPAIGYGAWQIYKERLDLSKLQNFKKAKNDLRDYMLSKILSNLEPNNEMTSGLMLYMQGYTKNKNKLKTSWLKNDEKLSSQYFVQALLIKELLGKDLVTIVAPQGDQTDYTLTVSEPKTHEIKQELHRILSLFKLKSLRDFDKDVIKYLAQKEQDPNAQPAIRIQSDELLFPYDGRLLL